MAETGLGKTDFQRTGNLDNVSSEPDPVLDRDMQTAGASGGVSQETVDDTRSGAANSNQAATNRSDDEGHHRQG